MQKYPLFFFILLTSHSLLSANCIQEYYQLTNQAELAICAENLPKASKLYQKAFALDCKIAFNLDLKNALTLSCELKKWLAAKHYATCLREKNYNIPPLKKELNHYFEGRSTTFLDKVVVNPQILVAAAALKKIEAFDQATRMDCPGYPEHCKDRVRYVDSIVYVEFIEILKTFDGWYPEVANLEGVEWLVIAHNGMWQRYWAKDWMDKAVKEGKLHPDIYANCIDALHNNNKTLDLPKYGSENWWVLNKENFLRKALAEEREAARKVIHMDSLEEEKIKLRYQKEHPIYSFSYNSKTAINIPAEMMENVVKNLNLEKF